MYVFQNGLARIVHRFDCQDNPNAPLFIAMDMFTRIREEVESLNQEIIVTCHFVSHHLTPFNPVLL